LIKSFTTLDYSSIENYATKITKIIFALIHLVIASYASSILFSWYLLCGLEIHFWALHMKLKMCSPCQRCWSKLSYFGWM